MSLEQTNYHSLLRMSAVVVACVLVFQSGLIDPATTQLTQNTQSYLAQAIGIKASVTPTEVSRYTAELSAFERELDAREEAITAREIEVGLNTGSGASQDRTTFFLSAILFILVVLIVLNYALDFVRAREARQSLSQKTQPVS